MFRKSAKWTASVATIAAVAFMSTTAAATTYRLQPASGNPFLTSGSTIWKTMQDQSIFTVLDGRSVGVTANSTGTWVTPIPVDATGSNWSMKQFKDSGTGTVETRICSFTKEGAFSGCSSTTSASNTTRTIMVPSDGTAFAQTFFSSSCHHDCELPFLHTIRATN